MKFNIKKVLKAVMFFSKAKKKVESVKKVASALKPNQIIGRATRQSSPTQNVVYDTLCDQEVSNSNSNSKSSRSSSSWSNSSSSSSSCD